MTPKKLDISTSSLFETKPLEESKLYQEQLAEREKNPPKKRRGRPVNENLIAEGSSQRGLPPDLTRASYIMPVELVDFIADYAYTERIKIQDSIAYLIRIGKAKVEKDYKKQGKELLRKEKK